MNRALNQLFSARRNLQPSLQRQIEFGDPGDLAGPTRILVPTDFSPCSLKALQCAIRLAQRHGAEILLLHVVTVNLEFLGSTGVNVAKLEKELHAEANEKLAEVLKIVPSHIRCDTLVTNGIPCEEISKTVAEQHIDLLVIGKRRRPFWNFAHHRTVRRLIDKSPCEVLVVAEEPRATTGGEQLLENRIQLQSL